MEQSRHVYLGKSGTPEHSTCTSTKFAGRYDGQRSLAPQVPCGEAHFAPVDDRLPGFLSMYNPIDLLMHICDK